VGADEHPYAVSERAERIMNHAGRHDTPAAHARAAATGLNRARRSHQSPPHATHIARLIPSARLVTVSGMGHAVSAAVVGPACQAILAHTNGF
jgi:hypothetical protein